LLVTFFLESHRKAPRSIVLDLETTETPLHGKQEARFFPLQTLAAYAAPLLTAGLETGPYTRLLRATKV
jgi:hypothetical protein